MTKQEIEIVKYWSKKAYFAGRKETEARGFTIKYLEENLENPKGCLWLIFNFFVGPITGGWYPSFMKRPVWTATYVKGA